MTEALPVDTAWQRKTAERKAALRRARTIATTLLVLMFVTFVICWRYEPVLPWLGYPRAFSEASMVGAFADWFAVVALFRRPMGLPIPHTAILPRNKQRMGDALGLFIASNFLAPAEIEARLDRIDAASWITRWLADPENIQLVVHGTHGLFPPALELLGERQLRDFGRTLLRDGIDSIEAAPLTARVLAVLLRQGYDAKVFDWGVETTGRFLEANRVLICQKVAESRSGGWLPGWVDARLTDAFITGFLEMLEDSLAPNHAMRRDFRTLIQDWIQRLADDPVLLERGERIKSEALDDKLVDSYLAWLAGEAEEKLTAELGQEHGVVSTALEHALKAIGQWLEQDTRMREMIDRWTRQLVLNAIVPNRAEIGAFVSDVVARWDTETLVNRLELQVGKDLQYIRVNGTIVGGLVGLTVYVVTSLLR